MKKLFCFLLLFSFSFPVFSQKRIVPSRTKEEILNDTYCTGLFNTLNADYFDFTDVSVETSSLAYLNVLDWLQGRVAGLRVFTSRDNVRIPYIRNQQAGVFVNEMWVSYDFLNLLPVSDIAMIKVIKAPFASPWGGPGGAIAIYTQRGDEEEPGLE